jgi:hypothetical protein
VDVEATFGGSAPPWSEYAMTGAVIVKEEMRVELLKILEAIEADGWLSPALARAPGSCQLGDSPRLTSPVG